MYNIILNFCAEKTQEMRVKANPYNFECIPDRFKTQEMCDKAIDEYPYNLGYVPDCFKTQEMCVKANPYNFDYIPDRLKTQEMCDKAVDEYPYNLGYVPDRFKTQEMCVKAFNVNPLKFEYIPDRLKTQEMCSDKFHFSDEVDDIPDWFITLEMIGIFSRPCCAGCDFEFDDWFNGYKERKAQKAQIRDELMPIAWHPDRVIDWCFDEEEKKDLKLLWGSVEL